MQNLNTASEDLYNKLRGRFPNIHMGDAAASVTTQPAEARLYSFEYTESGRDRGTVTVSLVDETTLTVIYSQSLVDGIENTQEWFDFLKQLRQFSVRNLLSFEVRNVAHAPQRQQDYEQLAVSEARMWGTSKTSYQKLPAVKLIVRHTTSVDETKRGARSRRISKIFAETAQGERFLLPTVRLSVARALGQHIAGGARPWDELAEQIVAVATDPEYKKLVQRAGTARGYTRLVAALQEDNNNMQLQLTEDRAEDLLVANGTYASGAELVDAVMNMVAGRTTSNTVRAFAENYTQDMSRAVELTRVWMESVRDYTDRSATVTEQDDRTVSALRQLAMDMGQLDRSDVNMVADMIADGSEPGLIRQYILDLDTAPREAILSTIDSFEPGMIRALFPKDHEEKYFAVMRESVSRSVKLTNIRWIAEPGMDIPSTMTIEVKIPSDADEDDVYDIIASTLEDEVGYGVRDFDFQLAEGYSVLPNYDSERYSNREHEGLEGPMRARNGKVVYYDKAEGLYYDPDRDMFITNDEWDQMNQVHVPGGDMYAAPKKFSHKSQTFTEAMTSAVAWPAQEYFDMSNEQRDEIGDCFAPYRDKIASSFENKNGQLMLVVDGDPKAMSACQKAMKQKGIKFMATESADLSTMANSRDRVETTYAAIIKRDAEETEVGDYIGRGMTKDQILKLIDMLEPQGYNKDFLLKDLAPMMEQELGEATTTIDPNKLYSGTFIYVYDDEYMVVSTNKDKTIVYAYDANSGETVPIKVSDITDMEEVGDDEIQDYPKEARINEATVSLDQARDYFFDEHDFAEENIQGEYEQMASKMSPKDAAILKKELEEFYPDALNEEEVDESIRYMHSLKDKGMSDEEIAKELNMTPEEVRDAMSKTESVDEQLDERSQFDKYKNMLIIYDPKTMEVVKTYPHTNAMAARKDAIQSKLPIVHGADFMELMVSKHGMTNALAKAKDIFEDMMPSDARKIADEDGVEVYVHSSDDEGSAIDVHKNGELVASGYYDVFAGDFVIDGKSYRELRDVVAHYGIPDMGDQDDLAVIQRLAGMKK